MNVSLIKTISFQVALFFWTINMVAQIPKNFGQSGNTPNAQSTQNEETGPDTTIYTYVLVDNIFNPIIVDDSLANTKFVHADPLLKDGNEHINTGNRGSSSMALLYKPKINLGFNTGYNQFDIYRIKIENFKFYEQNRPITDLSFSQLGNQQNLTVGAQFSRNFRNGLTVSLNYNRISQVGFFSKQITKSTNFGFGLRYESPKKTYNAFLIYLRNANSEVNNGGLFNTQDLENVQFESSLSTKLTDASTRNQEQNIAFVQYLKLNKAKNKKWLLYIRNDLEYRPSYYKYGDSKLSDTLGRAFYTTIPFDSIDTRGIRRLLQVDQFRTSFFINGERAKGAQGRLGLTFDYFNILNYDIQSSRTDLTLRFDGRIPIFRGLEMQTNAKLGLLQNVGNFDIMGKVILKASKVADLSGGIRFFSSEQSYNAQSLIVNNQTIYTNNFSKSIGTILFADVDIPKINFQAGIVQSVVTNPLFFNADGLPTQGSDVFSSTYLRIKQNIRVWNLHLDNQVHFQVFSQSIYPLPPVYSTHQLYITGRMFKKVLDINFGIDCRFIGNHKGSTYQPLLGEFTLTNPNTSSLPFYPASNLYLAARVSAFRALFVYENFSQLINGQYNLDVNDHAQFNSKFRFGFQWLLKD